MTIYLLLCNQDKSLEMQRMLCSLFLLTLNAHASVPSKHILYTILTLITVTSVTANYLTTNDPETLTINPCQSAVNWKCWKGLANLHVEFIRNALIASMTLQRNNTAFRKGGRFFYLQWWLGLIKSYCGGSWFPLSLFLISRLKTKVNQVQCDTALM